MGFNMPSSPQTTSKAKTANRQRQNTTLKTGWSDITTNQPIDPEMSMAALISIVPRVISLFMVRRLIGISRCLYEINKVLFYFA
jgi:hypothetical protein